MYYSVTKYVLSVAWICINVVTLFLFPDFLTTDIVILSSYSVKKICTKMSIWSAWDHLLILQSSFSKSNLHCRCF